MASEMIKKYAKLLVNYSMGLKKGDRVLLVSTYLAEELLKEVYAEALKVGAYPDFKVALNGTEKIFYDNASDEQLEYISPITKYVYENYNALLNVISPFNVKELQNTPAEKKQKASAARADLNKIFMKRAAAHELRWTLCVYPTSAEAQECGLSISEYEDFVCNICFLNEPDPIACWNKLEQDQQRVVDFLNSRKEVQFRGSNIDVKFSTEGRKWINSSGHNNMPSGEVFTGPVEDSVNGFVRFSYPGIYMGQEIEDISLEIKNGEVVKGTAAKGQDLLNKILDVPGARRFGEAAVGTNERANRFTKNMLFDEKMGGTIHMAIGAAYPETGATNESAIHWDLLADMKDGEILADGEVIYRNGKFIV
ncbi:MAG: peptidase M29 [Planctomycetes bacterium GWF2_42_9]|nr:MAG: peptidase M29 [Planctomycetes bacterium GWF2_42_9]